MAEVKVTKLKEFTAEELRQQFKDIPPNVKGIEGEWESIHGCFW